jgi:N-acetylneuraminic acid mutarotase
MPTARGHLALGVVNGVVYAAGGLFFVGVGGFLTNVVEAYDPVADAWTTKAPMPTALYGSGAGVVNGVFYALGGSLITGAYVSTVEAYDPATNTWTPKAPMPATRAFGWAVGTINGTLYVAGGSRDQVPDATVLAYDSSTNTWRTDNTPLPTPRSMLGGEVVNGVLYAVGGGTLNVNGVATNEAFTPVLIVQIDILPRIFPNRLNLRFLPAIPVAVLTTPSFNAADVAVSTVRFAGAAPALSALVDVDGDGDRDLSLLFATRDVNLTCASTQATLTGQTTTGTQIQGTDSVRITRDKTGQVCP